MKKLIILIYILGMTGCAGSISPAKRYAKEHAYREFTSWEKINKKMDQKEKSKRKEHSKRNKY